MSDEYTDRLFEEIVQRFDQDADRFDILPPKGPFRRVIVLLGVALIVVALLFGLVVAAPSPQPANPTPATTSTY